MNSSRLVTMAVVVVVLLSRLSASQPACDPTVRGAVDHPQGYRLRGDRCEGVYWQPHAVQSGLAVVGLRRLAKRDAVVTAGALHLGWRKSAAIPPATSILIKAVLLRSDLYYRMDTNKPYSVGMYDWPTDVLDALRLELKDVGVLAFTSTKIGGVMWQVYVPLDVGTPDASSSTYELTVVPTTALADLSWESLRMDDGIPGTRLTGDALKRQFPARVPIHLQIVLPKFEGFSYVEVSATALSPNVTEPLHADFAFVAGH